MLWYGMNDSVKKQGGLPTILMAEDNSDDRFFMNDAFQTIQCPGELRFVGDGEELMEYLERRGRFADTSLSPRPSLILIDLNVPKKDGRQVLREIKANPVLLNLTIVIWTTSDLNEDRKLCLKAGAADFLTKPNNYEELEKIVDKVCDKWLRS